MALETFNREDHPHRRFNPLTGEWILVSPHRAKRPWVGDIQKPAHLDLPRHDPACPLCPGNTRTNGEENPDYEGPWSFENDYSAIQPGTPRSAISEDPLFRMESARGRARVLCFSPDHSKTLPEMTEAEVYTVFQAWRREIETLGEDYLWVQLFENKGTMMGCSQPHPHGQVWATDFLPQEIETRDRNLQAWYDDTGSSLLMEYLLREQTIGERIICETKHWVALIPYWAAWPFETMLLPKAPTQRFTDLSEDQMLDGAAAMRELLIRYDNLFECAFPYSMGWHFAPLKRDEERALIEAPHWQTYATFYPPLLRSAEVRKFMVGYEMLAETQRDITPEDAARRLREQSTTHYRFR